MMCHDIFKNKFLLTFRNKEIETKFSEHTGNLIQKYITWFTLFGLIISLIDTIYECINYEKLKKSPELKFIEISRIVSYTVSSIFLIELILCLIFKNKYLLFKKIILYINYLLLSFPFYNLREILFSQNLIDSNLFAMIRSLELLCRITMVLLELVYTPGNYILNLIFITIICIYSQFINGPLGITSYASVIIVLTVISYFYTKQVKTNFFSNYIMNEQNCWYSNLLEHMNSGFLAFSDNKIKFINGNLKNLICELKNGKLEKSEILNKRCDFLIKSERIKTDEIFLNVQQKKSEINELNPSQINICKCHKEKNCLNFPKLLDNKEEILSLLLKNIKREYMCENNISPNFRFSENVSNNDSYSDTDFNLDYFLKEMKKIYDERDMDQKFLIIGYKEFKFDKNSDELKGNSLEKQKILNFEILFRYHVRDTRSTLDRDNNLNSILEDEYEIIFNEITKIKEIEEQSAELYYKTFFLSKVAHEFKNPLIGISELVEIIQQNDRKLETFTYSKNFSYLKQIKSFSNYLLILIRDLKYFSFINLGFESLIERNECDLNEILKFTREIAEVLLIKFNKKIKFSISKNFDGVFKFFSDASKLKQILVNLISNSIKNTNSGQIELRVNYYLTGEEYLEFQIKDTGIEYTEEKIKNILEPWSFNKKIKNHLINQNNENYNLNAHHEIELEFYVLLEILKRLNSKLKINSSSEGTLFEFKVKIEKLNCSYICDLEEKPIINIINCKSEDNSIDSQYFIEKEIEMEEKSTSTRKLEIENCVDNLSKCARLTIETNDSNNINNINHFKKFETNDQNFEYSLKQTESLFDMIDDSFIHTLNNNTKILLIVDDEQMTRQSTIRVVSKTLLKINKEKPYSLNEKEICNFPFKILEAEDGLECLCIVYKLLKMGYRDILIVSDENMKHMNGTTCAEILKNLKKLNSENIPFILLTAYHQINCRYIDYFVSKPLTQTEAEKIMTNYVDKKIN
jgi:CheY-like chemotaxis protein